jgi:hypothetical protein
MMVDSLAKQNSSKQNSSQSNPESASGDRFRNNLDDCEQLYQALLEMVKSQPSDSVLTEFKRIFFAATDLASTDSAAIHHHNASFAALKPMLLANREQAFRHTLKRSCYILVNNWEIARNYPAIQKLVQLFSDPVLSKPSVLPLVRRLRSWLQSFVQSQDFQELKLFAARYYDRTTAHWTDRYASYLLVQQYVNLNNPFEQRQAARTLYKKMKNQFKFDLALYTAHADTGSSVIKLNAAVSNPTHLGNEVVHLIKRIVLKRGFFNYPHLARIFLSQTQHLTYQAYKCSLIDYLIFSIDGNEIADTLRAYLAEKFRSLYATHHDSIVDSSLRLRTANRLIDYLTTEDRREPSPLFVLFLSRNASLTLVMILLKIILSSRYSRTHLEVRIADLIKYYETYSEDECQWVIHFLEVFNIAMTIHTENVEYSLVNMAKACPDSASGSTKEQNLADYRIFSQSKPIDWVSESDWLELAAIETLDQ